MSKQFDNYIVNIERLWKEKPELVAYLKEVEETECRGLISAVLEYISDGWDLPDPTPCVEQLAASIFMEASSDLENGPEYQKTLRRIGYKIQRLAGHIDPMIMDYCEAHNKLGSAHERKGNISESVECRRVAGMMAALAEGDTKFMFHRTPERMDEIKANELKDFVEATAVFNEVPDLSRRPCKICLITNIVIVDSPTAELAYVELNSGVKVPNDHMVVVD